MSDIVKRAREGLCEPNVVCPDCDMLREACDEIEMLRAAVGAAGAENERLRAALREVLADYEGYELSGGRIAYDRPLHNPDILKRAREALREMCIGCGAHDAPHQTVDGPMCSTCLANTGGTR